jgi:hypothetical protein
LPPKSNAPAEAGALPKHDRLDYEAVILNTWGIVTVVGESALVNVAENL